VTWAEEYGLKSQGAWLVRITGDVLRRWMMPFTRHLRQARMGATRFGSLDGFSHQEIRVIYCNTELATVVFYYFTTYQVGIEPMTCLRR
jgi:hypothetical protein